MSKEVLYSASEAHSLVLSLIISVRGVYHGCMSILCDERNVSSRHRPFLQSCGVASHEAIEAKYSEQSVAANLLFLTMRLGGGRCGKVREAIAIAIMCPCNPEHPVFSLKDDEISRQSPL
jgi:hypothetical protein